MLNVYGTDITEDAISDLESFANLKQLYLHNTLITREGRNRLQASLPRLKLYGFTRKEVPKTKQSPQDPTESSLDSGGKSTGPRSTARKDSKTPPVGPPWQRDFDVAMRDAITAGRPMFLYFTKTY